MSEDIIDLKEVMERVQEDQELFFELLEIFQEDYVEKRKLITELFSKKDFDQLRPSLRHRRAFTRICQGTGDTSRRRAIKNRAGTHRGQHLIQDDEAGHRHL